MAMEMHVTEEESTKIISVTYTPVKAEYNTNYQWYKYNDKMVMLLFLSTDATDTYFEPSTAIDRATIEARYLTE